MEITRRTALRTMIVAPVGMAGLCYADNRPSTEEKVESSQENLLTLQIADYQYDRVAALSDGRVKVDGCYIGFTEDKTE